MGDLLKALTKRIPADKKEDLMSKAAGCKDADEVIAVGQSEGVEISKAEAEAVLSAFKGKVAISEEDMDNAAGGGCGCDCNGVVPPEDCDPHIYGGCPGIHYG